MQASRRTCDRDRLSLVVLRRLNMSPGHAKALEENLDTTQVFDVNGGQGRNRTTDTRIFSIQLRLSTKFSIDLRGFIDVRFWSMPLLCMF